LFGFDAAADAAALVARRAPGDAGEIGAFREPFAVALPVADPVVAGRRPRAPLAVAVV